MYLASGGGFDPGEVDGAGGDAGASGDGDGAEFFDEAEFYSVGVVGEEALSVFVVERIVDVGLQVELQFFFWQVHFGSGLFADGVEIFEAEI